MSEYDHPRDRAAPATTPAQRTTAVGKQSLTAQLGVPPATRDTTGANADALQDGARDHGVHVAAAQGMSGSSQPLPFADMIQRAFGRHDISGIKAHVDAPAAEGARAMGARAFAAGDRVVFAGAPDLHTAAHEAAHIVQQRGGLQLKSGVGAAGDAHEAHANQVADRVVAGRSAEHLLDGYAGDSSAAPATAQVQRASGPTRIVELRGKAAAAKLAELGGSFLTDPDYSDGRKAIAGSHLQYTVVGPKRRTVQLGVHQWTHDGPDGFHMHSITGVSRPDPIPSEAAGQNGLFVNAHNVGSTTIPLAKPGSYKTQAWIRAGVDEQGTFVGYELYVDHVVEVTHLERALHEADQKQSRGTESFDRFHDQMSVQTALLRPGDAAAQAREHELRIATSAPNPAPISEANLDFTARDARKDQTKPITHHWYVSAQTKDELPETLAGRPLVAIAGRRGYDLGVGATIAMPADHAGFWVVWYQAKDADGKDVGEANYLQTILGGADVKSLEKHDQYMERLDEVGAKIEGEKLPIRAVHVSEASGNATQLRLFVGKAEARFVLIDATPGIDPKSNRVEYASASGPGVIEEFFRLNRYPKGRLRLNVQPNKLGIDTHMYEKETSGEGQLDRLSSGLSLGGMAVLAAGILAAPITRGQSLQVAMVFAGGLNAAAGAVSLYERLQHAEVSRTGVALDVINIASGLLNAGGGIRSLVGGPGVLLANRATKFLLWTNFVADGASGLLIGAEGAHQIADIIENDQLRPEQKREAVIRVVTNLIMAEMLIAVSYGQLHELRSKVESVLGKAIASKLGDEACMALAMLDEPMLRGLKVVAEPELTKLGRALRDEPGVMNLLRSEHRLPKVLLLMKEGTADDLRFAIMRANAHEAGVSAVNSERLVAALTTATVPSDAAMKFGKDLLARFAEPAAVTELEHVATLQRGGRVQGLGDWLAFGAKKVENDLANVVFELREAERQSAANPKRTIHIGGDNQAQRPANAVVRSDRRVEGHGREERGGDDDRRGAQGRCGSFARAETWN